MKSAQALAIVLIAYVLPGPAVRASSQVFKADVDAVQVDVLVTRDRRPVPGLTSADFLLLDNGVSQRVEAVSVEAVPITLVIALDTSASVAGRLMGELKRATDAVVAALRPGDRFGLLTFSQNVQVRVRPPVDPRSLAEDLEQVVANGDTALYDATFAALATGGRSPGRTVVLVFSDGVDTASWLDPRDVLREAHTSDVVVFGVTAPRDDSPGRFLLGRESLQREWFSKEPDLFPGGFLPLLVHDTGGSMFVADEPGRLRDQFVRVVNDYRSRYVLSYSPQGVAPGGWHELEVRLNRGRGEVRARRGYQR